MTEDKPHRPQWIRDVEAAGIIGYSAQCLRNWRYQTRKEGKLVGPPFYKPTGHGVRYRLDELVAWMQEGGHERS
jgi:hypothetical protein